jgi:predicted PolB exonuclease-like 3'-5' exonuclease
MVNKDYEHIFFIDVETVPQSMNFEALPEDSKMHFTKKVRFLIQSEEKTAEDLYQERAGILSEFNKIVCVSVGVLAQDEKQQLFFKSRSFSGHDEKEILSDFAKLMSENKKDYPYLCAHNGKEFDFPVLCRRMLINGVNLPPQLDVAGKKPWETMFIDTLDMWKFGDYKHYTSLDLLAHVFGIPSPKDDISGADVARVYYVEKDLDRIVTYCEKDIKTLAKVYMKLAHNTDLDI